MALIQSSGTATLSIGSTSAVWSSNTTNGNIVVVGVAITNATVIGTVSSITDSQNNTYIKGKAGTVNGVTDVLNVELWYAQNISGGAGSVTVNHTVDACAIYAREYSGNYNYIDVSSANSGSSTSPNSGTSGTTLNPNELLIVATGDDKGTSQTWTATGGYGNMVGTATTLTGISMEDKTITTTGAQTGTLTLGSSANWESLMIAFRGITNTQLSSEGKIVAKPDVPSLNLDNPLTRNLTLDAPLFEGRTNVIFDLAGNRKSTSISVVPPAGSDIFGNYYGFNGSTHGIVFLRNPSIDINNQSAFTILTLVNIKGSGGNGNGRIIDKWKDSGGTGAQGYRIYTNSFSANKFSVEWNIKFTTTDMHIITGVNVPGNKWILLEANYNELGTNRGRIYIDGVLNSLSTDTAGVGTIVPDTDAGQDLYIGSQRDNIGTSELNGNIGLVRIYTRILTKAERSCIIANPWCIYKNIYHLPFNFGR